MNFLKRLKDEIIATVKPSVVLLVSLVFWIVNKIVRLTKIFSIPILFLVSISLCLFLSFFTIAVIKGQRPWSSLGSLPHLPTEILDANPTDILVQANDGKYYQCTYEQNELRHVLEPIRPSASCWQKTSNETLESDGSYFFSEISKNELGWWVKKPVKAIDTLSFVITYVDSGYSRSHIIDETGEVWVQKADPWSAPDPEFYLPILIGIVGGIVLSIVIIASSFRFRKRKSAV